MYLRGFYGNEYKDSVWSCNTSAFAEACKKAGKSEQEAAQVLFQLPLDQIVAYYEKLSNVPGVLYPGDVIYLTNYEDRREDRPEVFREKGLFILPTKNGYYEILRGEGYVDIPSIETEPIEYKTKLSFSLDTSAVGDSEMQYLDKAYASSIIRTFMNDPSLVLTIRGRKYTPSIDFLVGQQKIHAESVQTEVDAGYEGDNEVVLIEAKNSNANNTIIRQLYYPYKQWQHFTKKPVKTLFFEHDKYTDLYNIWEFEFQNPDDYTSIRLKLSARFKFAQE